jgi:xylan 1,4-beta-xylosidase
LVGTDITFMKLKNKNHPSHCTRLTAIKLISVFCITVGSLLLLPSSQVAGQAARPLTFCNPIDIAYRFVFKDNSLARGVSAREAADPTMVLFKKEYWLFASKSGGYWHSKDMVHWDFIEPSGLPLEDYAPTVEVLGGKLIFTAYNSQAIYTTDDPAASKWVRVATIGSYSDPDLFLDDDGKLYMFSGSSPDKPICGVEFDPNNNFSIVGESKALLAGLDPLHHGWEARNLLASDEGIKNEKQPPWMEGAWMTKYKGTYYLQYAAPATEMKEYGDGVYTSDKPLGTYRYAPYNPFSYKPTGFITSAGHSSTYQDTSGLYWHVATMLDRVNYVFERRIGIFPAGFVPNGSEPDQLVCNTYLGDYPQLAPGLAKDPLTNNLVGWMLLSLKKKAAASSTLDDNHKPELAFDEDVTTSWAAATANPGEWLSVDLGKPCRIDAVQINFADVNSTSYGRISDAYRYTLEVSDDGKTWKPCIDRKDNMRDAPHEYIQLDQPVTVRYVKLTNIHTPAGAVFSVSGLRLFGSGLGKPPELVDGISAERQANGRLMKVSWKKSPTADFYIVRYGINPDRLTFNYQVYNGESVTIPGLNTDANYFFTVDAVNDTSITKGTKVKPIRKDN